MRSYTVKSHADQEFDNDYNYVSVIDMNYEGPNREIQVLEVEVNEADENRYQRALDWDHAVISWCCNDVFDNE